MMLTPYLVECSPKDKVYRAYPRRYPLGRSWNRRGLSGAAVSDARLDMDGCIQEFNYSASHDPRGLARRHISISFQA